MILSFVYLWKYYGFYLKEFNDQIREGLKTLFTPFVPNTPFL